DELPADIARVGCTGRLPDFLALDRPEESVRAEHDGIPAPQLLVREVHLHLGKDAEGLEDHVPVMARFRVGLIERAGIDEFLDERLVPGELGRYALADEVRA